MTWTKLHARLHQTCRQKQLLPQGDRLLVAVSGGQDSLTLLKLLLDLQPKWQWQIIVAHCDHNWSTDAGIADRVAQVAQDWHLPFYLKKAENLAETEAAARKWRYEALIDLAQVQKCSLVVTGHTESDRAETLLYNLIRGAGADGLQALTWRRNLTPEITLVRPLLNVSRSETGTFAQQLQLPVWEDVVNTQLQYARNRLRLEVIPYLQKHFNPKVESAFAQTAELLQADVAYLETTATQIRQQAQRLQPPGLNRHLVQPYPLALRRRVVRQFMQDTLNFAPNFEQINAVVALLAAPNRSQSSTFPGGAIATVQKEWIIWTTSNPD
ncbi:MAG: tRNA lysidine(34) synthetase TilS [Jaaginema sp. PMC 1079.18]|nr:tRNA lysidine(34) synthetase TilS [Jaaginema sp. PMC 1080.18]MEC4852118.1 tRNA lysidine(34) synthetase TilS [Jaaginema sp. PMC 1079.18]MEC4866531.1 tRNA lysidine(34) synthetase TilS [Jaaginema sp. PMC 1078.18]